MKLILKQLLLWVRYYCTQVRVHAKHARYGNVIHPTAYIHPEATMGVRNYIGPYCYIGKRTSLGANNHLEAFVSIGTQPEHEIFWTKGEFDDSSKGAQHVWIGNDNVFREFVTVQGGTKHTTMVGNHCKFLRGSHVSHDTTIEDRVTVSCNVLIGGESTVMKGANLGLGAIIHQRQVVGAYSMLGMGVVVPKKTAVLPGMIYVGNPARELGENHVGFQRAGGYDHIQDQKRRYTAKVEALR